MGIKLGYKVTPTSLVGNVTLVFTSNLIIRSHLIIKSHPIFIKWCQKIQWECSIYELEDFRVPAVDEGGLRFEIFDLQIPIPVDNVIPADKVQVEFKCVRLLKT